MARTRDFQAGATSRTIYFRARDATTGDVVTTLAFDTPGLSFFYIRDLAAAVTIPLVAQTITGAWVSGGFVHVSGGVCRLDQPDAVQSPGVGAVRVAGTLAGVIIEDVEIALPAFDSLAAPPTTADIATAVWAATTRTLSSFGTLIADIWVHATRALTDKVGFALTPTTGLGNQTANITGSVSGSVGSVAAGVLVADGAIGVPKLTAELAGLIKAGGTFKFGYNPGTGVLTVFEADGVTPIITRTLTLEARDAIKAAT